MDRTTAEIASQPERWERASTVATDDLPSAGTAVAVLGCGTSYYVAQAYASLREGAGRGTTDAYIASEYRATRPVDHVVAISRSGTTSEVVDALAAAPSGVPTTAITAVAGSPVARAAGAAVALDFADEESVVQTRFATTALAYLRAHLGEDLGPAVADARVALAGDLPDRLEGFERFVFLGRGWAIGLANEAALKLREAALAWAESYAAFEYRHGPISLADERTLVWFLGERDAALAGDVAATGAALAGDALDPMAELVRVQRAAVALAHARGLDPDAPRNLTRSVVLG